MKVTVDFDCTPEEARRFMGLPDLSSVHEVYVEKMRKLVLEGVTPDVIGEMMKSWGPMSEASLDMWTKMLGKMGGKK